MFRSAIVAAALLWATQAHAAWEYSGKTDAFSDERISTATLFKTGFRKASLIIRCKDGLLESYTNPAEYIGDEAAEVRFRFDKSPPQTDVWDVSTEGTAAFATYPVEFARHAISHASVATEIQDYEGTPHTETFSLAGASGPITRVLADCGLMAKDPQENDSLVWRRVVHAIDALSASGAKHLGELVSKLSLETDPINARRTPVLYAQLSSFYRLYWDACRARVKLSQSCTDYLEKFSRRDEYPKEAVDLLIEYASTAGGDKVKFWTPLVEGAPRN